MQRECRNIYENARRTAGMTQERWAEALGISDSAVRQYEAGDITPSDEVVRRMIEVSMLQPLGYWHLCRKSDLAADMLPSVDRLPLAQAVVQLLARIRDFDKQHHDDTLLEIAADGKIDDTEMPQYKQIVRDLQGIIQAALQIDFAEKEG